MAGKKKTHPADEGNFIPPAKAATPEPTTTNAPNKSQAVRNAIAAGVTMPTEGCKWIKEQYGLDVTPAMFSAVKNSTKAKSNTGRKSAPASPATPNGSPTKLAFEIKTLMETYGKEEVTKMVDAANLFLNVQ